MNKTMKILLTVLVILGIIGFGVWKFVINKPISDSSNQKPTQEFSFENIFTTMEKSDSITMLQYKDALLQVTGNVKKIHNDNGMVTVEMGNDAANNTINFQMDNRYKEAVSDIKEGSPATLKGTFSGYQPDDEMGLGSTIQFKYATIVKK